MSIEEYKRSHGQNEYLGLNDIKTEKYEPGGAEVIVAVYYCVTGKVRRTQEICSVLCYSKIQEEKKRRK